MAISHGEEEKRDKETYFAEKGNKNEVMKQAERTGSVGSKHKSYRVHFEFAEANSENIGNEIKEMLKTRYLESKIKDIQMGSGMAQSPAQSGKEEKDG